MWRMASFIILLFVTSSVHAQENTYTKINFDKSCTIIDQYEQGMNAVC